MRRALLRPARPLALLDEETWDAPRRLTDDDFHAAAGPDWRRAPTIHDILEEEE